MAQSAGELDEYALFVRGPVVVFRWQNADAWPVEYVSPNAKEVFGYTAAQFLKGEVSYAAIVHEDDLARVGDEVQAAQASSEPSFIHEPYRVHHRDGSVRWLYDLTHLLRDGAGAVTHFLGYVIDITSWMAAEEEKRALERQLLHAQKLESLGLLAGGVAHDFNNVLTGILGEASLARHALRGSPEKLLDCIERIELSARRATKMTDQLVAYSGNGHCALKPLDFGVQVSEIVDTLAAVLPKKTVVRLEVADELPGVLGDAGRVQQLVMNLLTNASEALGGDGGEIVLRLKVEDCDAETFALMNFAAELAPGRYVSLEVEDGGCGMSQEIKDRLFEPFFTTKRGGNGLGTAAILGIMRDHHGALNVASTPGYGTTFKLLFPASARSVPEAEPVPAFHSYRGRGTVLVVDDDATVRFVASRMLQAFGFETLVAGDGAQAIDLCRRHADDIVLVLSDIRMPVMDGTEVVAALRRLIPGLLVLFSSAYKEQPADSDIDGAAFLAKPYSLEELALAVRGALGEALESS